MAIGLARMFGFKFPLNFNSPYKSASIQEFWRRWHITLSRFLRNYLYIPLGGNRRGPMRRNFNLMVTMLLGGLWHGANWTFVLWGGVHGAFLMINRIWSDWQARRKSRIPFPLWISIALTFLAVTLAWVPFRADSLSAAGSVYAQLFGLTGPAISPAFGEAVLYGVPETIVRNLIERLGAGPIASGLLCQVALISFAAAIAFIMPNTAELFSRYLSFPDGQTPEKAWSVIAVRWTPNVLWLAAVVALFAICLVFMRRPAPFLYFQF